MKHYKILVLDDSNERNVQFVKNNIGHVVVCVETAPEAIEKVKLGGWDIICLDHDLGGKIFCPSDEKSGWIVAKFIADNPQYKPSVCVILHSFNSDGRKNQKTLLPDAIEAPSCWTNPLIRDDVEDAEG